MQSELTSTLRQRERLAQLGSAVAKVSHDLRNILTSAQLFADRIETSEDPVVARMAPKLMNSITRAVHLCESTLAFGKAEEPAPTLGIVNLEDIVDDVVEGERLAVEDDLITISSDVPIGMMVRADSEQLYRVLSNLTRNARQALVALKSPGEIKISAGETEVHWWVRVSDDGPGLPKKAQENLFTPFQGGARKGGSGLGLAIASELLKGHGGDLKLAETGPEGTTFELCLPKSVIETVAAAQ